jgi:hypothetical protein
VLSFLLLAFMLLLLAFMLLLLAMLADYTCLVLVVFFQIAMLWWPWCLLVVQGSLFLLFTILYMPVYSDLLVSNLVSFWSIKFLTFD